MKLPQRDGRMPGFTICLEVSEVMPGGFSCGRDSLEGRQGGHASCNLNSSAGTDNNDTNFLAVLPMG